MRFLLYVAYCLFLFSSLTFLSKARSSTANGVLCHLIVVSDLMSFGIFGQSSFRSKTLFTAKQAVRARPTCELCVGRVHSLFGGGGPIRPRTKLKHRDLRQSDCGLA